MWVVFMTSWKKRENPAWFMDGSSPCGDTSKNGLWLHYCYLQGASWKTEDSENLLTGTLTSGTPITLLVEAEVDLVETIYRFLCSGQWPSQLFQMLKGEHCKTEWGTHAEKDWWIYPYRERHKVGRFLYPTLTPTVMQPSWNEYLKKKKKTRKKIT